MQVEKKMKAIADPGVFTTVVSWFKNLFTNMRSFRFINIGVREVMPDMDSIKAIDKGFNANAAVYSIVVTDAEKFASVPRYLADPKKVEEKNRKLPTRFKHLVKFGSPKTDLKGQAGLEKLLNRPNEWQGQAAFLKTCRAFYKTAGENFIWLNRGDIKDMTDMQADLMPVLEMIPLPSQFVDIVPDDSQTFGGVAGYILKANGQNIPLRKSDVIHWKDINLAWDASTKVQLRGMSALRPGAATLQQNEDGTYAAVRMYKNDGVKGALYNETMDEGSPEQQTQIKDVIDSKINSPNVKGAIAALQGKWGFLDLSVSSVDMQLLDGIQLTWQILCFLMGVPYEFFNAETTFANKEMAQKNWVNNRIIPACKEFDDELNRVLLRSFGLEGKVIIQSDYTQMPELQENMAELAKWLLVAFWITPNEKREMQGYEAINDEKMDEPWMPNNMTPLSQMQGDGFDQMMNEFGTADYGTQDNPEPDPQKDPEKKSRRKRELI